MKNIFLLIFILFSLNCNNEIGHSNLSIGFWNVENLFDLIDDPDKRDEEFALNGRKNVTQEIYNLKIKNSVEVLRDLDVDILGLCEVENKDVLNDLNDAFQDKEYKIIHYESPDERGIDNALLYDPKKFKVLSSKPIRNVLGGDDKTRDILYVEGTFNRNLIHIFVNHWPSNYGGKEKSIPKRNFTSKLLLSEIQKINKVEVEPNIILLGDFNEDPDDKNVLLLESAGLTNLMTAMIDKEDISTYIYRGTNYLYDQIIVSNGILDEKGFTLADSTAYILDLPKYRQQKGKYKKYPFRFWAGNKLLGGYSDHLAVKVDFIIK
jgi:predicted extracellular nuclease